MKINSNYYSGMSYKADIYSIALYAIENELTVDNIKNGILKDYNKSNKTKNVLLNDIINSCYQIIWKFDTDLDCKDSEIKADISVKDVENTIIIKLVDSIFKVIELKNIKPSKGRFNEQFYIDCVEYINKNKILKYDDEEILIINLKQTVMILRAAGFIKGDKIIKPNFLEIYKTMIKAFWDKCNWKSLFPSGNEIATFIKMNRSILLDLILSRKANIKIEELSLNFFDIIGLSNNYNLFLTSFLDFSVLTWLSNFGIIKYNKNRNNEQVSISLTKNYKKFISILQS